ncbi:unnamed protein product [Symbiodinium sp. CCMP2456]|nr:unnamed protein product [Symbiodinium sp. CCMP2456]
MAAPGLLYVDGLNISRYFFPQKDLWDLTRAFQKVEKFVAAAKVAGFQVSVFLDASIQTDECMRKWFKRREEEVKKMNRGVPQGIQTIVGDMFAELGIKVYFSLETDLDDALAAFAEADGAAILSADSDFFRYEGATYQVYEGFEIVQSRLELIPADGTGVRAGKLAIISKPQMVEKTPAFIDVKRTGIYTRGACSPLVRLVGNPHAWLRPLRQALYSRLGLRGPVTEVFPSWDASARKVVWSDDEVFPDGALDHFLEDPIGALQSLVPDLVDQVPELDAVQRWRHIFGVHAVVHELCCAAKDSSLFRALVEDDVLAASAPWRRGKGKGKPGRPQASTGQSGKNLKGHGKGKAKGKDLGKDCNKGHSKGFCKGQSKGYSKGHGKKSGKDLC